MYIDMRLQLVCDHEATTEPQRSLILRNSVATSDKVCAIALDEFWTPGALYDHESTHRLARIVPSPVTGSPPQCN